jgi:predicted RNA binding protein YcfA (HicA-like mRNA interferase family)
MKLRDITKALRTNGCTPISDNGSHTKWTCPCGQHSANLPRHTVISPGVVRDTSVRMACLKKGWLQ